MKSIPMTETLRQYLQLHAPAPSTVLPDLVRETLTMPGSVMQITPEQGIFMAFLARLIGARKILEVGCYTGYSAICLASALPEGGSLLTMDIDPRMTGVAEKYFAKAKMADKITVRLAPALTTLQELVDKGEQETFDLMFIDADKANMLAYYEFGLKLLRKGGLIICDNVLWNGDVVEDSPSDERAQVVKEFNRTVAQDERVDRSMINIADGLYLLRKR